MNEHISQINNIAQAQIEIIKEKCKRIKPVVVISCLAFSHEKYIREALDGFVKQKTKFPFVAIIHDDASTDGTAKIIKEFNERYPDIIMPIFEDENQYSKHDGSIGNIVRTAREATGANYIAMCEGDDYWTDPLKLQKQVDALEAHPECTIVLHKVQAVDKLKNNLNWTIPYKNDIKQGIVTVDNLVEEEFNRGRWTFHTSSFLYRKEMDKHFYGLRKKVLNKFPYGDMPLLLACLLNGNGYYISDIMGSYRFMSGGYNSQMADNPMKAAQNLFLVADALRDFNKYTEYKYCNGLNKAITRFKIKGELNQNDGFSYKWLALKNWEFYKIILYRFVIIKMPWIRSVYRKLFK